MANRLSKIQIKKDINTNNRYYKNIEYLPILEDINDIYIISKGTDRLDLLAFDYYKNSQLWWVISKANPDKVKRDSFFLNPGVQIRIPSPSNISVIYEDFKLLNK
jgi:hypothetical protein|tara:strand:- start:4691 stop:5005 length:315 start_codon:yes stop_codon:yes gene_type:complete